MSHQGRGQMLRLIHALAMLAVFASPLPVRADVPDPAGSRYVVLITIDGFRWEDLFRGADPSLVTDDRYRARYVDVPDRAQALTPFLLSFAQEGALIGDRDQGSCARVSNEYWFSYPGYSEVLVGRPNPNISSNQAIPNDDVTVLERLARRAEFADQVRVFAEWDVIQAILNTDRSGIPVFNPPDPSAPHDPQVIPAARAALTDPPRVLARHRGDSPSCNRCARGDLRVPGLEVAAMVVRCRNNLGRRCSPYAPHSTAGRSVHDDLPTSHEECPPRGERLYCESQRGGRVHALLNARSGTRLEATWQV